MGRRRALRDPLRAERFGPRHEAPVPGFLKEFGEIIEGDLRGIVARSELQPRIDSRYLEIREIHHRLKNQFNLLNSFINLQANAGQDLNDKEVLKGIQHRVIALALINEELLGSRDTSMPELGTYLRRLCAYILEGLAGNDIEIEYSIGSVALPAEKEISIALILAELLTNSIKHAFPGRGDGRKAIFLASCVPAKDKLRMVYRDNGVGFPPSFDPKGAKSLGMVLVCALVRQLNGEMKIEGGEGAGLSFLFRIWAPGGSGPQRLSPLCDARIYRLYCPGRNERWPMKPPSSGKSSRKRRARRSWRAVSASSTIARETWVSGASLY